MANGYPLVALLIVVAVAGFCWTHRWLARLISLAALCVAGLAVLAFPAWMEALATVFGSGPGLLVLLVLAIGGGGYFVVDQLKHHHPVRSAIFGVPAGTAIVLAWAMRGKIGHQGSKILPKTIDAFNKASQQISTGHAAHAISKSSAVTIVVIGVLALIAISAMMHKSHKKREFKSARAFGEVRALPAGTGGGGKKKGFFKRIAGAI